MLSGMTNKERCPGIGAYAKDRAGNPRASCPVCRKSVRLTKRGTIRFHKRVNDWPYTFVVGPETFGPYDP